jgi:hypothetical protein
MANAGTESIRVWKLWSCRRARSRSKFRFITSGAANERARTQFDDSRYGAKPFRRSEFVLDAAVHCHGASLGFLGPGVKNHCRPHFSMDEPGIVLNGTASAFRVDAPLEESTAGHRSTKKGSRQKAFGHPDHGHCSCSGCCGFSSHKKRNRRLNSGCGEGSDDGRVVVLIAGRRFPLISRSSSPKAKLRGGVLVQSDTSDLRPSARRSSALRRVPGRYRH